jgi:hypothetical protein
MGLLSGTSPPSDPTQSKTVQEAGAVSEPAASAGAATPPITSPKRFDQLRTWLRAVWWIRGVVAAVGLVGLAETVFRLEGSALLHVTHAITAAWRTAIVYAANWINLQVPLGLSVSPADVAPITIFATIIIPAAVMVGLRAYRTFRKELRESGFPSRKSLRVFWEHALPAFLGAIIFQAFWQLVWTDQTPNVVVAYTEPWWNQVAAALTVGVFVWALWRTARTYIKAMFTTLSFIAMLELLYYAPVISSFMEAAAAWLQERTLP